MAPKKSKAVKKEEQTATVIKDASKIKVSTVDPDDRSKFYWIRDEPAAKAAKAAIIAASQSRARDLEVFLVFADSWTHYRDSYQYLAGALGYETTPAFVEECIWIDRFGEDGVSEDEYTPGPIWDLVQHAAKNFGSATGVASTPTQWGVIAPYTLEAPSTQKAFIRKDDFNPDEASFPIPATKLPLDNKAKAKLRIEQNVVLGLYKIMTHYPKRFTITETRSANSRDSTLPEAAHNTGLWGKCQDDWHLAWLLFRNVASKHGNTKYPWYKNGIADLSEEERAEKKVATINGTTKEPVAPYFMTDEDIRMVNTEEAAIATTENAVSRAYREHVFASDTEPENEDGDRDGEQPLTDAEKLEEQAGKIDAFFEQVAARSGGGFSKAIEMPEMTPEAGRLTLEAAATQLKLLFPTMDRLEQDLNAEIRGAVQTWPRDTATPENAATSLSASDVADIDHEEKAKDLSKAWLDHILAESSDAMVAGNPDTAEADMLKAQHKQSLNRIANRGLSLQPSYDESLALVISLVRRTPGYENFGTPEHGLKFGKHQLRPWQITAAAHALTNEVGLRFSIIGDDMGLGKTISCLLTLVCLAALYDLRMELDSEGRTPPSKLPLIPERFTAEFLCGLLPEGPYTFKPTLITLPLAAAASWSDEIAHIPCIDLWAWYKTPEDPPPWAKKALPTKTSACALSLMKLPNIVKTMLTVVISPFETYKSRSTKVLSVSAANNYYKLLQDATYEMRQEAESEAAARFRAEAKLAREVLEKLEGVKPGSNPRTAADAEEDVLGDKSDDNFDQHHTVSLIPGLFGLLIVDEAHTIRNIKTIAFHSMLAARPDHVLYATGTILWGKLSDFGGPLTFIDNIWERRGVTSSTEIRENDDYTEALNVMKDLKNYQLDLLRFFKTGFLSPHAYRQRFKTAAAATFEDIAAIVPTLLALLCVRRVRGSIHDFEPKDGVPMRGVVGSEIPPPLVTTLQLQHHRDLDKVYRSIHNRIVVELYGGGGADKPGVTSAKAKKAKSEGEGGRSFKLHRVLRLASMFPSILHHMGDDMGFKKHTTVWATEPDYAYRKLARMSMPAYMLPYPDRHSAALSLAAQSQCLPALALMVVKVCLDRNAKLVVFCHAPLIQHIVEMFVYLTLGGESFLHLGSEMNDDQRQRAVKSFQDPDHPTKILVVSSAIASTALNLHHCCRHAMIVGPNEFAQQLQQQMARVVRLGQELSPVIWIVTTKYTYEDRIQADAETNQLQILLAQSAINLTEEMTRTIDARYPGIAYRRDRGEDARIIIMEELYKNITGQKTTTRFWDNVDYLHLKDLLTDTGHPLREDLKRFLNKAQLRTLDLPELMGAVVDEKSEGMRMVEKTAREKALVKSIEAKKATATHGITYDIRGEATEESKKYPHNGKLLEKFGIKMPEAIRDLESFGHIEATRLHDVGKIEEAVWAKYMEKHKKDTEAAAAAKKKSKKKKSPAPATEAATDPKSKKEDSSSKAKDKAATKAATKVKPTKKKSASTTEGESFKILSWDEMQRTARITQSSRKPGMIDPNARNLPGFYSSDDDELSEPSVISKDNSADDSDDTEDDTDDNTKPSSATTSTKPSSVATSKKRKSPTRDDDDDDSGNGLSDPPDTEDELPSPPKKAKTTKPKKPAAKKPAAKKPPASKTSKSAAPPAAKRVTRSRTAKGKEKAGTNTDGAEEHEDEEFQDHTDDQVMEDVHDRDDGKDDGDGIDRPIVESIDL